jgi:hypothetical protein
MPIDGIAPEMVAREDGREGTAEVWREWVENKDRYLREREVGDDSVGVMGVGKERKACSMSALDTLKRKRLHVKQSVDCASTTTTTPSSFPRTIFTPSGEYIFYDTLPLPSHSPNATVVAQTLLEILVVESIQEGWGSARYAHYYGDEGVSTPDSLYHHSASIVSTPPSASPSPFPITIPLPSSCTTPRSALLPIYPRRLRHPRMDIGSRG